MAVTDADYLVQLQQLLPPGRAWPRDPNSALGKLLYGLAGEMARVDQRAENLINEALPNTTSELLPDWERVTNVTSRDAVVVTLTTGGGSTPAYFIALASALGITVAIDTSLTGSVPGATCDGDCERYLQGYDEVFYWQVDVTGAGPMPNLEALFHRLKPAHTLVLFVYS